MQLINDEQSNVAHFCTRLCVPPPAQHVPVLRGADHNVAALQQCIVRNVLPLKPLKRKAVNETVLYSRASDSTAAHFADSSFRRHACENCRKAIVWQCAGSEGRQQLRMPGRGCQSTPAAFLKAQHCALAHLPDRGCQAGQGYYAQPRLLAMMQEWSMSGQSAHGPSKFLTVNNDTFSPRPACPNLASQSA